MPFSDTIAPFCEEGIQKEGKPCPGAALHLCSWVWPAWGLAGACEDYNPGGAMFMPRPSARHGGAEGGRWRPAPSPAFCWWRAGVFSELLPKWGEQQGRLIAAEIS